MLNDLTIMLPNSSIVCGSNEKLLNCYITEQEKCSSKPLLKEKIHDLMQAFPLDAESH